MNPHRCSMGVAIAIIITGTLFLVPFTPAAAETLNFKTFNHTTKMETIPIPDVEGHSVVLVVREGVAVFEKGELGWHKVIQTLDFTKGAGTTDAYFVCTFLDGSTFIVHTKGTLEATPQGVSSGAKTTGDIIGGSGRFQGIKGTMTAAVKSLPLKKGNSGERRLQNIP